MPEDPGYGCDNDLNNYGHSGSSVLNDNGYDSGSSGFNWGSLVNTSGNGSNSNADNPYVPSTNFNQPGFVDYSSYGNPNFHQQQKPALQSQQPLRPTHSQLQEQMKQQRQRQQQQRARRQSMLNNAVLNRGFTNTELLDTGDLLGKNPLKKNVLATDVLDARTKTFFERLQNEPVSYFPHYHPEDNVLDYDYVYDRGDGRNSSKILKTNVAILIASNDEISDKGLNNTNSEKGKSIHGQWEIIVANDMVDANEQLSKIYGEDKVENIVIETHGDISGQSRIRVNQNNRYQVSPELIEVYNSNPTNDLNKRSLPNDAFLELKALEEITIHIKDNGKLVIGSCNAGQGDAGTNMGANLAKLSGNRIYIYLNQDYSTWLSDPEYGFYIQDVGLTEDKNFFKGWKEFSPDGTMNYLKNPKKGYSGNIFLHRNAPHNPIQFTLQ